jgi:hypothetical protein
MNRRELVILSGAAIAAQKAVAQTQSAPLTPHALSKALLKITSNKASLRIPKSQSKVTKYVNNLSAALSLTPDQQSRAASIFSSALTTRQSVQPDIKTARQNLVTAVKANDVASIGKWSVAMSNLKAQLLSTGASAHAAFYQTLTQNQIAKLNPSS